MSVTNEAAILFSKGDLRLEKCAMPEPGAGEVQIAMKSVGICGSDIHYWTHGAIGDFVLKAPMVIGHESSGVVSKLGPNVADLKVGDRVAIEPGVPCHVCSYCKGGRYNLCLEMKFCATPPCDGSLTRFYVHSADYCYKLPDHVSFEEGALLEPLSVGVHACRRAGVTLGSKVLICGAGTIGLVNFMVAKCMGASNICITDISESRLAFAKKIGVHHIVLADSKDPEVTAQKVEAAMGEKPDITIECSGAPSSIQTAIYATRSGGCVVLVGLGPAEVSLPIVNATVREVDIRGIFRYVNCYPTALEMIASGQVDAKCIITHRYTMEQTLDAFERAKTMSDGAVKVMINVDT